MPVSKQRGSYEDVRGIMDKALDTELGVRVPCETPGAAIYLIQRLNTARVIDRKANKEAYPETHPMYGNSAYDRLIFRNKGEEVWVEKITENRFEVLPLTPTDVNPQSEPPQDA